MKINKLINSFRVMRYDIRHRKEAKIALKSIEKYKGKVSSDIISQCDDYANNILGSKKYAWWLYVYSALNEEFKKGWIPDNYYGKVVVPILKGDYKTISDASCLQPMTFNSDYFPDIAYYINGLWLNRNNELITRTCVKQLLRNKKIVFKLDFSSRGEGVYVVNENEINVKKLESKGNGCIQEFILQHSFFNQILPDSVATIRVTSFFNIDGRVIITGVYLRLGRKNEKHVKSSTTIRVAINPESGVLDKFGYIYNWERFEKHPDTGFKFENSIIPHFQKCIDVVKELHKKVPFIRIIGWDLIIDREGEVKVMEWNGGHNDIKFTEAIQGPNFSGLEIENLWKINK